MQQSCALLPHHKQAKPIIIQWYISYKQLNNFAFSKHVLLVYWSPSVVTFRHYKVKSKLCCYTYNNKLESHVNQFMYTLFNPEICGVYWISFSFTKWMSLDLVNNDDFLATEPRKLVTFAMIVMVTISSSEINMNHNDTESKLQKIKRNQDFCLYLYPFPGSKRRQRGWVLCDNLKDSCERDWNDASTF